VNHIQEQQISNFDRRERCPEKKKKHEKREGIWKWVKKNQHRIRIGAGGSRKALTMSGTTGSGFPM